MDHHMQSCYKVAKFLENHPQIDRVLHPALSSHPQHQIACNQSYGHSGVFAFKLKNSSKFAEFFGNLKVFAKSETIGSFESFMTQTEVIENVDCDGNLIMVSIGLENVDDLIEDVRQALNFGD